MAEKFTSVDAYIDSFPQDVQVILTKVRRTLHEVVPESSDKISYQIPAITVADKPLVYFAGWQKHISLYPIPETDAALEQELAPYKASKGTLKFPSPGPFRTISSDGWARSLSSSGKPNRWKPEQPPTHRRRISKRVRFRESAGATSRRGATRPAPWQPRSREWRVALQSARPLPADETQAAGNRERSTAPRRTW